jgi:AAA domain
MTLFLVYGNDSTGKTIQIKSICEMSDSPCYISLEIKNRKLLKDSGIPMIEALVIQKDYKIDPVATYEKLGKNIEEILNNPSKFDTIVIDGISEIPRYAEKVVIKEIQKQPGKAGTRVIGKENIAAWAVRNNLAHLPMERLSSWAEIHDKNVFLTSLMCDEYVGEKKVGRCVDAKDRLRKLCDVRVMLTNDGRGYLAHFEKVPAWAKDGTNPVVVGKGGLATEFSKRGLL